MNAMTETGCCPRFDPTPWDEKEVTLTDKPFVQDRVRSLFHIPLNFGGVMRRNMEAVEAAGAKDPDQLILTDDNSPWGADVYIAVTKEIPGARMASISGTFFTKVFEGPYSHAGRWTKEMKRLLEQRGRPFEKLFYWYTTCPSCAKAYGKNYVVLVAQ